MDEDPVPSEDELDLDDDDEITSEKSQNTKIKHVEK